MTDATQPSQPAPADRHLPPPAALAETPAAAPTSPPREDPAAVPPDVETLTRPSVVEQPRAPIRLVVLDHPTGKGRPRFNRQTGRTYTPLKTTNAEARIRHAWDVAHQPTIPAGVPIAARIELYVDRPMAHYKRDGTLTKLGQREATPHRQKPDVDNAAKLELDALEKYAYPRDVAIIDLHVTRRWVASRSDPPRVEITLTQGSTLTLN